MSSSENESDQTIVINDMLSFISCKLRLCNRKQLLKCVKEYYSREEALESLKTLLTALPNETSNISRKLKEGDPFVSILEILEGSSTSVLPLFVCKNLNNIPKIEIIKEEFRDSLVENKKEFYKEHQRIKSQLGEVFGSLYELKKQFQAISDGNVTETEQDKEEDQCDPLHTSPPKDLLYLQNLIDEDEEEEDMDDVEEMFDENFSDSEDEDILEQRINLIANRRQRASLKLCQDGKTSFKKSPLKQKVIQIENDGKTSVSDSSDCRGQNYMEEEEVQSENTKQKRSLGESKKDNCRFLIVEQKFDESLGNFTLFKCSSCLFCSNDESSALDHACIKISFEKKANTTIKLESSATEVSPENQKLKRKKQYECYSCGSAFKMRKELQKHIETHLELGHRCPLCANRFSIEEWQEHVRACPGDGTASIADHYCELCDVFYADKRTLSFHKAFHDPSRPFECLECKFRFYTQKTVEDHFRAHKIHRNSKKCPFCEFRSAKQIKIVDHIRCHTGDRPYKCPDCERSCPTYNALKVHLTSHAPTRDFACDICGKKFKSQSKVASHRKIHTVERPHKCPICGKGFKFGLQMALHHRMHLDIRKHACPQCPYKARTAAILRGHMNTHTNIKPFKCSKCDFGANHKSYLNWHMKYYHPDPSVQAVGQNGKIKFE